MKILELCLSPDLGGLELYVEKCCAHMQQQDIDVLVMVAKHSRLEKRVVKLGVELLRVKSRSNTPLVIWMLSKKIDEYNIDIIHVHWAKDLFIAIAAKKLSKRKVKVVLTRQMLITRRKFDLYHKYLYGNLDYMIVITKQMRDCVLEYVPINTRKVEILYHGVTQPKSSISENEKFNGRNELGFSADTFLIGIFGRLHKMKGQHLVLEALKELVRDGYNASVLMVGHSMNDNYPNELNDCINNNELNEIVVRKDFTDDVQYYMQLCDVVVLATDAETFGLVLPEAMRCGTAVIGSNQGGVPEIIQDGNTGLLFESGSSSDLSCKLRTLIVNDGLKLRISHNGKKYSDKNFSIDNHFKQLKVIFNKVYKEER